MNIEKIHHRLYKNAFILGKSHILSIQMLEYGQFSSRERKKFSELLKEITKDIGELYYKDIDAASEADSEGHLIRRHKIEEAVFGLKDK